MEVGWEEQERTQQDGNWEGTGSILGGYWEHWLTLSSPDILLNVFLAIAVDNLADGDNINSGAEKK